jgi:hypothetical protein
MPKGASVASPPGMFAEAGMKRPPDPQVELIGGPYVQSDIERMIPIFIALNDALTKAASVYVFEQEITANWQSQFQQLGASAFAAKIRSVRDQVIAARDSVYKIVEDHNADRNELDTAVRDGTASVEIAANAMNLFIDNIDALSGVPEAQQIRVLNKDAQRVQNAGVGYNAWVQASIQHAQSKIRRLRDYKP